MAGIYATITIPWSEHKLQNITGRWRYSGRARRSPWFRFALAGSGRSDPRPSWPPRVPSPPFPFPGLITPSLLPVPFVNGASMAPKGQSLPPSVIRRQPRHLPVT